MHVWVLLTMALCAQAGSLHVHSRSLLHLWQSSTQKWVAECHRCNNDKQTNCKMQYPAATLWRIGSDVILEQSVVGHVGRKWSCDLRSHIGLFDAAV